MSDSLLPVTLFADFTCPFCYVTEVGLESIAAERPLELRRKAFELFPAPSRLPDPPHAAGELESVASIAEEVGVELRLPPSRPRTRKAHEAALFAATHGMEGSMRRALYRAYWSEGRDIGRIDVLMALTTEIGLDPTDLKIALDIDRHEDAVLADLELARRLRVTQVPTVFVGSGPGATILQGARSLAALDEAVAVG